MMKKPLKRAGAILPIVAIGIAANAYACGDEFDCDEVAMDSRKQAQEDCDSFCAENHGAGAEGTCGWVRNGSHCNDMCIPCDCNGGDLNKPPGGGHIDMEQIWSTPWAD